MATLGAALASNVLGHSEAEKAFRPWWDNFEDYLIYGLITLGKFKIHFICGHIATSVYHLIVVECLKGTGVALSIVDAKC